MSFVKQNLNELCHSNVNLILVDIKIKFNQVQNYVRSCSKFKRYVPTTGCRSNIFLNRSNRYLFLHLPNVQTKSRKEKKVLIQAAHIITLSIENTSLLSLNRGCDRSKELIPTWYCISRG